ncbi:uncharacterized protein LOC130571061 isoform X2 [Triplophysa rosa]|uniref:uncharacterized protein LOC130571061 isoform X2 n=1 Tax=Triplophysa rosa TaxID=992332 RepID=UPI002545D252|nr:uncharacterized protein LOC130571061 isoform X2 [Triplophysa rosa]
MEVAVCRHGFLLKALNMYRGEIFAYPLYLQKELMPAKAQFFAMDVACKYWPYLEKAASVLPALQDLTKMKPFLSVMHARAHATKCEIKWSGRNKEGAGTTAGEEVEQVNSYLSRCALTTKYMSKAETPDTSHASQGTTHRGLQQSIEGLYLSVRQRKQTLYRQNGITTEYNRLIDIFKPLYASYSTKNTCYMYKVLDCNQLPSPLPFQAIVELLWQTRKNSSKLRHRLRRKLAEDKKLLLHEIEKYNGLVLDSATNIDVAVVEHSLTGESTVSQIWPWEVHASANISMKKQLHDQVMLTMRLQEEKSILVLEMAQHCTWLQSLALVLKNKIAEEDKGNEGRFCVLRRRLSEVSERLQVVLQQYKTALGPEASALLHVEAEDQSGLSSPDTSEDEEENTI